MKQWDQNVYEGPSSNRKNVTKPLIEYPEFDSCLLSQEAALYIELSNSTNISTYKDVFQFELNTTTEIFRTVLNSNSSIITRKRRSDKRIFLSTESNSI